jgi:hypothetical protein
MGQGSHEISCLLCFDVETLELVLGLWNPGMVCEAGNGIKGKPGVSNQILVEFEGGIIERSEGIGDKGSLAFNVLHVV